MGSKESAGARVLLGELLLVGHPSGEMCIPDLCIPDPSTQKLRPVIRTVLIIIVVLQPETTRAQTFVKSQCKSLRDFDIALTCPSRPTEQSS